MIEPETLARTLPVNPASIPASTILGMLAIATWVLLWMIRAGIVLVGLNVVTVILGLLVRWSRAGSVLLLSFSTWLWAVTFTLWCALQVLAGWGTVAMLFGLFLGIVGIIPAALLCLIATHQWGMILQFGFQFGLVLSGWTVLRRLAEIHE